MGSRNDGEKQGMVERRRKGGRYKEVRKGREGKEGSRASKEKMTYKERLRKRKNLILRQESIFILIMQIEEPLDIFHEVVEHDTV